MTNQNKGGRPREGGEVKLAPLNMRTSPELREKIEQAADASGRSLTQEIEQRLRTSFSEDDWLGGWHIRTFVKMLGSTIDRIEGRTGKKWIEDQDTWFAVEAATRRLLAWDRPQTDEDGKRERAGDRMLAAFERHDKARKALADFYEQRGLPEFASPPAPEPVSIPTMFGGRMWHDPRAGWTDGQKQEEEMLLATERVAAAAAARAGNAYRKLTRQLDERRKTAGETGQEVASDLFRMIGPKPKRQAEPTA